MLTLTKQLKNSFEIHVALPEELPYWKRFKELLGAERLIAIPHRKFTAKALLALTGEIDHRNIDLLHSHGKGAGLYSRIAGVLTGRKVVHTFHGVHTGEYGALKKWLYLRLEKLLGYFTVRVIAVSHSEFECIRSLGILPVEKLTQIENGIEISAEVATHQAHEQFRVVTVTRFDFAKNPELLAEIVESTCSVDSNARIAFDIIGEGDGSESIHSRLVRLSSLGRVRFHGWVEDPKTIFANADCYLSTSRWEGLPLAILEAAAQGCPAIASNVQGNIDVVKEGETGFLYPINSPEAARSLIERLANQPELVRRLGSAARKRIIEKYSDSAMARKTSDLYRTLLAD